MANKFISPKANSKARPMQLRVAEGNKWLKLVFVYPDHFHDAVYELTPKQVVYQYYCSSYRLLCKGRNKKAGIITS